MLLSRGKDAVYDKRNGATYVATGKSRDHCHYAVSQRKWAKSIWGRRFNTTFLELTQHVSVNVHP